MTKLHDTARAFVGTNASHTTYSSGAFTATPWHAYSYDAMIAQRLDNGFAVTRKSYSVTTSKHTNAIRNALRDAGYTLTKSTQDWDIYQ